MRAARLSMLVALPLILAGSRNEARADIKDFFPAADSIGEIRLKTVFKANGDPDKCGVLVSPRVKAKFGRLLVFEIRNGCTEYNYKDKIELRDFQKLQSCGAESGESVAINDIFEKTCVSFSGNAPWNAVGYAGCLVKAKPTKGKGCYRYSVYIGANKADDPELEISN